MTITFTHNEGEGFDHSLKTTADNIEIEICFQDDIATTAYIGPHEYDILKDELKGFYFNIGSGLDVSIVPASFIIEQAERQIEGIAQEAVSDQRDWDRHVQSYSTL
ncbi:MAG: hypothetical protein DI551_10435 [Micavibrio aeruginosavorus]|uniref:Uncharacterized protein n=1 Tax=Micavibrio aeruginosavorus TaxID=349221 RepID=A0A2W5PP75_9BACT|nr:MAG: hypothetical protein DI551_10435 [Micavibrio aeruginosavorus]